MSNNPIIKISNDIDIPKNPKIEKETFERIFLNEFNMFAYTTEGFNQVVDEKFKPENDKELYFVSIKEIVDGDSENPLFLPSFVSLSSFFGSVFNSSSGFLTFNESIAPRLFMTSSFLVDNGIRGFNEGDITVPKDLPNLKAVTNNTAQEQLFNWSFFGSSSGDSKTDNFGNVIGQATEVMSLGGNQGNHYVSMNYKNDKEVYTRSNLLISQRESGTEEDVYSKLRLTGMPLGAEHDWNTPDDKLVVEGAFSLTLHVLKTRSGNTDTLSTSDVKWSIRLVFGEVVIFLNESGPMIVTIGTGENNKSEVELPVSKTSEVSPQSEFLKSEGKEVIDLIIYPVWNGIIISNGVQLNNKSGGVFVPKTRNISIYDKEFIKGNGKFFDPDEPEETVILSTKKTKVDFGDVLLVSFENCRAEIAYLPLFFSPMTWFDTYFIGGKDSTGFTYEYNIYPIYTANGLTIDLDNTEISSYGNPDLGENSEFKKVRWKFETKPTKDRKYIRHTPELFGYHLQTLEEKEFFVKNENGNFQLKWKGGVPGDPLAVTSNTSSGGSITNSSWWDYVTNVSVSIGLEGLSGSISVDKYGLAGQEAITTQDIGAIVIEMINSPTGTTTGTIFSGLAYGVADATAVGSADWTINIVGLDKKMEDISLIDVPFFDGFTIEKTTKFLSEWVGIERDTTHAPNISSQNLSATDDINSPKFNFTLGTAVKDAWVQVMDDVHYWYYIDRFGKLKIYELDSETLIPPTNQLGPDRKDDYPTTKMVGSDQTPDFEDLRNEIIVTGLTTGVEDKKAKKKKGKEGNKKVTDVPPTIPLIVTDINETVPSIPWSRPVIEAYKGFADKTLLNEHIDRVKANSKLYQIIGKVTIPGNAEIEPYDRWGDFVIVQVSHNIDLVGKTWTTDMELIQTDTE